MTNKVQCDLCHRVLKEEAHQAQVWNASITTTILGTDWVKGPVVDLCGNCFDKLHLTKRGI